MDTPSETELKLRIAPEAAAVLKKSAWWRGLGKGKKKLQRGTYFDTPDHALRALGVDLRIRYDGTSYTQTMKLRPAGAASMTRLEWEALVPDAVPDPGLVIDDAVPEEVRRLTSADVGVVFDVDVERDIRYIETDGARIELALDSGVIRGGDREEPIHELELELIEGDVEALFETALLINEIVPTRLHLRTKSDAGYALAAGPSEAWMRADKLVLSAEMSAGDALAAIVQNCLSHLTSNDSCAVLNLHEEGVHQSRVALRRLRSALQIFEPVLPGDKLQTLTEEVRWFASAMGPARDLDVLEDDLLDPVKDGLDDASLIDGLAARAEELKADAYGAVREALTSKRYGDFLITLCAFAQDHGAVHLHGATGNPAIDVPVTEFAVAAMTKLHRKLLKRGRKFEKLSTAERHRVRIAVKKMRYVVEFFGELFERKTRKRFSKRLAALQEDLGRLNDVAMAETMLVRLTEVGPRSGDAEADQGAMRRLALAAGQVLGWHQRRAKEIDAQLVEDWYAFAEVQPFWLD